MADKGDATNLDVREGAFKGRVVRAVAQLAGVGLLGDPARFEVEERGGGRNGSMCMVEMDGPRPEGGGGVKDKSASVLGDNFGLPDAGYAPTQGDAG